VDLGLKGKLALVTGGTAGLGLAIAESLVKEDCRVVVAGRDERKIATAVEKLRSLSPHAKVDGQRMDVSDEKSLRDGLAACLADNAIDILVNNVGGPAAGDPLDIPLESWDKGYQSLLRSVIISSQVVIPRMKEKQWGRILTITSTSARELIPKLPVSSTFRAGLTAYTKELAKQTGRWGILVNNLLPGPTRTDRLTELSHKSPKFYAAMESQSALGRVSEPDEIGRIGAFLVSGANTVITGTDVLADGGYTSAL